MKRQTNSMTPYRYFLVIFLFICILVGLRWAWNQWFPLDQSYHAIGGIVDLRGADLETTPLTLDGEWEWYPGALLTQGEIRSKEGTAERIAVPGSWGKAIHSDGNFSYGYGTYRLRILLDPLKQPVAFWFRGIQAASEVEVNGEVLGGAGRVAAAASEYSPYNISYRVAYSEKEKTEIELIIRAANFDSPLSGGIMNSVRFGSLTSIDAISNYSIGFQLMIILIMLLHGLYACIIYLYRPNNRLLFATGLVYILVGLAIFSGHDKTMLLWLPVSYTAAIKFRTIVLLWQNVFILLVYKRFAGITSQSKAIRAYIAVISAATAVILFSPVLVVNVMLDGHIFLVLYLIAYVWFIWTAGKLAFKKEKDADVFLLLITGTSIMVNLAWSILEGFAEIASVYYPLDLMIALVVFSVYWFKKYMRNTEEISELYEQLKAADKLKDQFLANTSHELRTPLHGIMNITGNIYTREKDNLHETSRKEMELLGTISRRMSYLLDDLLDITMLQDQRISLQLKPLKVQSVLPGIMAMLKYMADGKPLVLKAELADTLPPVLADEKRFVQIMYNLLHNALKYTERGTITVTAGVKGSTIEIQVSDTGAGMDGETQARIFKPYEQGVHGISDGRGIGLGLSICKQLVDLHSGTLSVISELDRGSAFFIRLPLAAEELPAPAEARNEPLSDRSATAQAPPVLFSAEGKSELNGWEATNGIQPLLQNVPIRVLAVDDDPVNLSVLEGTLSTEPYHITTVCSAQEALDLLDTGQWDLLITDVMMPRMSGYELAQRVRERYSVSELPVLLLTARSQPADIYTGFLAGANDYVTKPADSLELKYRIRSLIMLKQSIHDRMRIEAAYLQAQIQPHFLFNTLNSLMVLSEIDTSRMRLLGEAFTSFLRISFDYLNTGELVDIAHELELVRAYLYIEQERFGDRLSVVWEVDSDIHFLLPPLSIQPLVENAVKHGLMSRLAGGTVCVSIKRRGAEIFIEVRDNGIGMDANKVSQLLNPPEHRRRGIGIFNTNRRLVQLYGQGLSISSKPGEGTSMSFVITKKMMNTKFGNIG